MAGHVYVSHSSATIELPDNEAQTLLQLEAPTSQDIVLTQFDISFDGTDSADTPAYAQLVVQTSVATSTNSGIPISVRRGPESQASYFVDASTEPSGSSVIASYYVTPIGGLFSIQFPLGREPMVRAGERLGLVVTSSDTVGATAAFWHEE